NDFLGYMKLDPLYRKYHHNELTFSMVYAYSENFVLVLSHDEVVHEKGSMITKMPGGYEDKFSNLRVAYGYMMTHPGKKLLFMGQEIAQFTEFNEASEVDWSLFEFDAHVYMQKYVKELNSFYANEPALFELDQDPEGFQWINANSANTSLLSYIRRGKKAEDTLVVLCNFTPIAHKAYKLATPSGGRWEEVFSSDSAKFGGEGTNNKTVKQAKKEECDGFDHYISVQIPPLSISVFKKKIGK
ncbi:MAG: alpha amylase C-terminal domain-containing protein, partial [Lachnospiraceae bacterium]|nr:alpha amylase C-terminal domain-containing protein [Lachnospiraceae bacterium]